MIDPKNEGTAGSFDVSLVNIFSKSELRLICFGGVGISEKGSMLLNNDQVNAIAYGNILNYVELAFQKIKKSLRNLRRS